MYWLLLLVLAIANASAVILGGDYAPLMSGCILGFAYVAGGELK